MRLDYVLALKIEDFLERRLQTQVGTPVRLHLNGTTHTGHVGFQVGIGQVNPSRTGSDQTATHSVRLK